MTGEVFDMPACLAWMDAQDASVGGQTPGHPRHNLLLYPGPEAGQSHGKLLTPARVPDLLQVPSKLRLIVLDGTWRKSRKMLYLNPSLQLLPRLSLQGMHATEIDFSPGTPSLSVTTRRRFTPQGTSCSFLQAVTQPLHSIQRSASQTNFIRAIFYSF